MRPFGFLRRRSLQVRITTAFVAGSALLVLVLSLATLLTVQRFLEDQRIRSSTRQTLFAVLFAREFLASRPDLEELVSSLQIRQSFDAMVATGADWYATSLDLTPAQVPRGLAGVVASEGFGYQIDRLTGERFLIFGTPLPPDRTDLYLFFTLSDIDRTMSLLLRAMAGTGVVIVLAMLLLARRTSRRILHPLAAVSVAAQRMAEGLLETRVEPRSSDELGQLASSFNQMAEALRDMIQHERRFVAALSHELRTPLAALSTAGEVMRAYRDQLPADGREALDLLHEDLVALRQLVEELLEVSELDSGRAAVRLEDVRVRALVETVLRRRRRDAAVAGDDVTIYSDKARLDRIVGNLVDNAFTHGEGAEVSVSVTVDADWCVLAVSDSGPGIGPDELPLLFRRFYKPDRSRTRERGGVGLGLAIARENAVLLGGRLDVASEPGRGTTFTVRLPLDGREGE